MYRREIIHLDKLDMVLGILEEAGFLLKREKWKCIAYEVVYMEHKID